MSNIEIMHPCGERRIFLIESIHRNCVTIRWGMSGLYEIDLKTGKMRAKNIKSRRKGDCLWFATNIEVIRNIVQEYFNPKIKTEVNTMYNNHLSTMPYGKKSIP